MSGKRTKQQLTKDQVLARGADVDSSDGESQMDTPQVASAEVMATRKIAGANRRFMKRATRPSADANAALSIKQNKTSAIFNGDVTYDSLTISQMKSLNANFLKSVNDGINKNPIADFSEICSKYLDYVKKVQEKKIDVKRLDVPKVEIKADVIKSADDKTKPNPFAMFASLNKSTEPESNQVTVSKAEISHQSSQPIKVEADPDSDNSDDSEKKQVEIKGPEFKIGELPKAKGGFKFGYVPPKDDSDSEDIEIKGPTFSTNVKISDAVFKFPTETNVKKEEVKPAFSFGKPEDKKEETKPAFSFGKPEDKKEETKPAFSFGKPEDKKEETKPAFTFGSNTATQPSNTTSAFQFGSSNSSSGTSAPSYAFSFGKKEGSKSDTSNPFNFGSNATFNNTSSSVFNFTAPSAKQTQSANGEDRESSKADVDPDANEAEKDTVQGSFAVVNLTKKVDVQNGEENEDVLILKRSKITKFNTETKAYDNVGVGEFKILKNVSNSKSRILVRSDGSGNVLLNVRVLPQMKYELMGEKKNMLRIPSVTSDGNLETYIARVKTSEDGEELLKTIQSCQ